ncbi:porin [Xenorhabdus innexi]|uniref:Outer membrane porin n=1 Tax=Xenorhabdus innexi TaxID=290109 RepID=A0A1N6N1F5_9GAMM|nr:porin [Xenorhabdus innexi]PHM37002.1 outer membrane porin precursor [Xenorhabdus innexi]SIP74916.1 Outer membrane protein F [Xenorhabdus innexi]
MTKHNAIAMAIAMAIPAFFITGTANAAEIYNKDGNKIDLYGKAEVQRYFAKIKSKEAGDNSFGRIGIKGTTQLTDSISGYGRWEFNMGASRTEVESSQFARTRLAFAGFGLGKYGTLDYGRNFGVVYDANFTDMMSMFSGDSMAGTENFMMGRATGLLTYRNTDFFGLVDGLKFALQYQAKNDGGTKNTRNDVIRQNGDGIGISSSYDFGHGVTVAASYGNSNRTTDQKYGTASAKVLAKGNKAEAWMVSAKYDRNNVYLAAMYGEARNLTRFGSSVDKLAMFANKTENLELTAQYLFDFGLRPGIAYVYSKGKDLGKDLGQNNPLTNKGSEDLFKYISIGASYNFNKNLGTYAEYQINLLKDNDFTKATKINTENVMGVGLVYRF